MIVPCYNESRRIDLEFWRETIRLTTSAFWLFVNDGSTDSTSEILLKLTEFENVRILDLARNRGKPEAIRLGVLTLKSTYGVIGYVDADKCFSALTLSRFVNNGCDTLLTDQSALRIVIGSRVKLSGKHIVRSNSRHWIGRLIVTFCGVFWSDMPYDPQSGIKLLRVDLMDNVVFTEAFKTRWFFDIELMIRLGVIGSIQTPIIEIPLEEWHEVRSNNFTIRSFPLIARELITICLHLRRASRKNSEISS